MPNVTIEEHNELQSLAQACLAEAKQLGATSADVLVGRDLGMTVSVRMGEVETVEQHRDKGLSVCVYIGHQVGNASTSDFGSHAVKEAVKKAYDFARFTTEDPCVGLADKELLAKDIPDLGLYCPWALTSEQAINLAKGCESEALARDKRITNSEGVIINTHNYHNIYANSDGFLGEALTTRHSISCHLIAEHKGGMQRDYEYTVARSPSDLWSIKKIANQTAEKTVMRLDAKRINTKKVPVIFSAPLARGLLGNFVAAINGNRLYRKISFLVDHLEKQVFPDFVTIEQQPHLLKGLGSSAFDDEGVATKKREYVKEGILQSYVLNSYSARRLKMQTTGNAGGVFNLLINHTDDTLADLLEKMDTGLLVTELIGQGVNLVTGDYSRGAFGYWVEKGEIQFPVQEITIAGNLKSMFRNIQGIANDVDRRASIQTGSILLAEMTVGGE